MCTAEHILQSMVCLPKDGKLNHLAMCSPARQPALLYSGCRYCKRCCSMHRQAQGTSKKFKSGTVLQNSILTPPPLTESCRGQVSTSAQLIYYVDNYYTSNLLWNRPAHHVRIGQCSLLFNMCATVCISVLIMLVPSKTVIDNKVCIGCQ